MAIPHKIWPYTVQYLHFRIPEIPIDNILMNMPILDPSSG